MNLNTNSRTLSSPHQNCARKHHSCTEPSPLLPIDSLVDEYHPYMSCIHPRRHVFALIKFPQSAGQLNAEGRCKSVDVETWEQGWEPMITSWTRGRWPSKELTRGTQCTQLRTWRTTGNCNENRGSDSRKVKRIIPESQGHATSNFESRFGNAWAHGREEREEKRREEKRRRRWWRRRSCTEVLLLRNARYDLLFCRFSCILGWFSEVRDTRKEISWWFCEFWCLDGRFWCFLMFVVAGFGQGTWRCEIGLQGLWIHAWGGHN
jgi:hypothetical protein